MSYSKKPCQQCPFRHDVKPFLTPERGEELAFTAQNLWATFPCHKTTDSDDDGTYCTASTKECAGFLTLRANELGEEYMPEGFKPSYDVVYSESYELVDSYHEASF